MTRRKRRARTAQDFGSTPDLLYFSGDMTAIRSYFDDRRESGQAGAALDDATWDDLDMDRVFQRINLGLSNAGEQCLYDLLRTPALEREEYDRRRALIALMEEHPKLRERLHGIFAGLGRRSNVDVYALFHLGTPSVWRLGLYLLLACGLLASIALFVAVRSAPALMAVVLLLGVNSMLHHRRMADDSGAIATVQYSAAMVGALKKLLHLGAPPLEPHLRGVAEPLTRLKRLRGVGSAAVDDLGELFNTFLLLDLMTFEVQKRHLISHEAAFLAIYQCLGGLDAALSIASYRKSLPYYADPELDHAAPTPYLICQNVVHPLVTRCVPNSIALDHSMLLTGSNATGKTTFLRTLAVNLILAQGVCTATAKRLCAAPMRVFTAIQITDSLMDGESYYISELKALKRTIDALEEQGPPVFCCLDEIFRGTNAVERISGATEILAYLDRRALCAAATHDLELCALLPTFALYHFAECIDGEEMYFDYRLREGRSTSPMPFGSLASWAFHPSLSPAPSNGPRTIYANYNCAASMGFVRAQKERLCTLCAATT